MDQGRALDIETSEGINTHSLSAFGQNPEEIMGTEIGCALVTGGTSIMNPPKYRSV
jgi:hypothetical protein